MKKYILILSSIVIVLFIIVINVVNRFETREVLENVQSNKMVSENTLTMMYETEVGSGEYQVSSDTSWPQEGYIFNANLSSCENGSKLTWDDENKRVLMQVSTSDKWYVYFDKYNIIEITTFTTTKTPNSITLNVETTPGDNPAATYYFTANDGGTWESSTTNSYTYNNLEPNTEYNFKVYIVDTLGFKSNEYVLKETTNEYINPSVSNVVASNITSDSVTISVTASGGTNNIAKYYYSKDNGASWVDSTNSSYTFTGLSGNTTYNFKVYVTDTAGHQSNQSGTSVTTKNPVYFADYIKGLYTSDGENGIYYHDSQGPYGSLEAGDNSYRYTGEDPNNYVCFGSDSTSCPRNNWYRIIGVFGDQVKLIKSTSYGEYAWDEGNSNVWSSADINNTLNSTYLNSLGSKWSSLIATHTWYVGGHNTVEATAKEFYNAESKGTTWSGKVGLMYASDFGYAANYIGWTSPLSEYTYFSSSNWMDEYYSQWTITRNSGDTRVFYVSSSAWYSYASDVNEVKPVFYLNSDVELQSGNGTSSNPFRIS